jgi:hypothetical protein
MTNPDNLMPAPPEVSDDLNVGPELEAAIQAKADAITEDEETGETVATVALTDGRSWDLHFYNWSGAFVRRARLLLEAKGFNTTPRALIIRMQADMLDLDDVEAFIAMAMIEAGDPSLPPLVGYKDVDWNSVGIRRVVSPQS